jgi:hypothetical protein
MKVVTLCRTCSLSQRQEKHIEFLLGKTLGKWLLERFRRRNESIKMGVREKAMRWTEVAQHQAQWQMLRLPTF